MKTKITSPEEVQALNVCLSLNNDVKLQDILHNVTSADVTILKFSAEWCRPCKDLSAKLAEDMLQYPELYSGVSIFELNLDDDFCDEMQTKYDVTSIPLCVVLPNPRSENIVKTEPVRIVGCQMQQLRDAIIECQKS
jgi:thiol-disulfide isomerase/thioredoxin